MTARRIRTVAAATVAATLAITAAACSKPGGSDAGSSGSGAKDSAVVGIAYEPESLSPLLGYG
ncbi:ABC transporter substrate-binding protein, partial [Streptomyces sp. NPDC054863]